MSVRLRPAAHKKMFARDLPAGRQAQNRVGAIPCRPAYRQAGSTPTSGIKLKNYE
jgi:hypothetical protein